MPIHTRNMYKATGRIPVAVSLSNIRRNRRPAQPIRREAEINRDDSLERNREADRDSAWSTISSNTSSSRQRAEEARRQDALAEASAAAQLQVLQFQAEQARLREQRQREIALLDEQARLEEEESVTSEHFGENRPTSGQRQEGAGQEDRFHGHEDQDPRLTQGRCQQWVNSSGDSMGELTRAVAALTTVVAENRRKDVDMKTFISRVNGKMDLPKFYGDAEDWPAFYMEFIRSTQQYCITDQENIRRLQKCLKSKAKDTVRSMLISSCKLSEIVDVLERRFGRPKAIINSLLEKARCITSLREGDKESIVDFSIAIKNLCATVNALRQRQYMQNPQLLDELVQKLPDYLQVDWARYSRSIPEEDVNIQDFSIFLDELATAVVRVSDCPGKPSRDEAEDKPAAHRRFKGKRGNAFVVAASKDGCPVGCKHHHEIGACHKFKAMKVDERWNFVKEKRLCFSCLEGGHSANGCEKKVQCPTDGCPSHHHHLLHNSKKNANKKNPTKPVNAVNDGDSDDSGPANGVIGVIDSPKEKVLMKVLPVTLYGPNENLEVYAYLDEGASVTILDDAIATRLGLGGRKTTLDVGWIDGSESVDSSSRLVELEISGVSRSFRKRDKQNIHKIRNVYTKKNLQMPIQRMDASTVTDKYKHLSGLPIASLDGRRPLLLIGQDNCNLILTLDVFEGGRNEPVASFTRLGWVLHGNTKSQRKAEKKIAFVVHQKEQDEVLHEMVKAQFKLDAIGISVNQAPRSQQDERAEQMMQLLSSRVGASWETGLLWKNDDITIPESYKDAFRRLRVVERQMDKDSDFADLYCAKIDEYKKKDFCHKLTQEELAVDNGRIRYLAHFGTTNPNKPGKLRLVVDCKAQANGVGLNDLLLQGPDLMTPLICVLARFRQREIAFSGDIRDMFHMFRIRKEDLPAQRFLWRGMDRDRKPDVYCMDVMMFGSVSSPYQAQWLKNRNAEDFRDEFGETTNAIKDNHYVDDYLDSAASVTEAVKKIQDVREIHRRGGMEIRGWLCSSPQVLRQVAPNEVEAKENLELSDDEKLERVLGMYWNPKSDSFQYKFRFRTVDDAIVSGKKTPSKRDVLKLIACLFDPLGFLSHMTIKGKILLQDIWRSQIGWDEEIPVSLLEKWKKFYLQLLKIPEVRIPRCYAVDVSRAVDIQLHVFCDSSDQAMCCVAYFRVKKINEEVETNIIIAKTRVAPLRPQSIPRLELQAALMGSRLVEYVKDCHDIPINSIHMWTDSKTVLAWLRADDPRRFKPFVSHRLGEILEHTDVAMWRWVPTKENVADEGTRDVIDADVSPGARFFVGPSFLQQPENKWPVENIKIEDYKEEDLEIRRKHVFAVVPTSFLPEINDYSSWGKLIRVTGWMLRFVENLKKKKQKVHMNKCKWLQVAELDKAESIWIKKVQLESFSKEVLAISNGKSVDKTSRLFCLSPVMKDGILCVSSRIIKSPDIPLATKYPILLDPKHRWTKLLVDHHHASAGHHGQERLFNELRQKYWILDSRTAIRSAWSRCGECRLRNAKPVVPEMAALPEMRVTMDSRPFTHVGMDLFGPIETTHLRRKLKRYGVIFVCLKTRAIHLEMAYDLTTDSTIMAVHRFISRRGEPKEIWSDNGTNLRGAAKELKRALTEMDQEKIANSLTRRGVDWHFIPPSAPHMGGSWERQIRSVKTAMGAILKNRVLTDEVLLSVLGEAEAIVNGRPLTYVPSDKDDVEAITPNCFLMGTTSLKQPPGHFTDADLSLRKKWRHCEVLKNHFWRRWLKEYIPTLSKRVKWNQPTPDIKIGDLVFIADSNLSRDIWPKGKVIALFPGDDGSVRVAEVKTQYGIFKRPVAKLYRIILDEPLE